MKHDGKDEVSSSKSEEIKKVQCVFDVAKLGTSRRIIG